jgi:ERCC4-type nuclease
MVHIHMDVRERDLIPRLSFLMANKNTHQIQSSNSSLALGDIVLTNTNDSEDKELVIIERKSVADLMASIKDGRYDEQAYRLSGLQSCSNHNIIFLIEGTARFKNETDRAIFQSAIFSIIYYKGFSVMHSASLDDTAYIVWNMANKIHREQIKKKKVPYHSVSSEKVEEAKKAEGKGEDNQEEIDGEKLEGQIERTNEAVKSDTMAYCSVIKKVKKENINADNIAAIMLSQVPGVSSAIATAICGTYKTIPHLVGALQENPKCLEGFTMNDSVKNKPRKISKSVIAKIEEYFCQVKIEK